MDRVFGAICSCLTVSVLKMWNYDLVTLEADKDVVATLNDYGSREDLQGVLGVAVFDSTGRLVSVEAVSISYFLEDRSTVRMATEWIPSTLLGGDRVSEDSPG